MKIQPNYEGNTVGFKYKEFPGNCSHFKVGNLWNMTD